MSQPEYFVGEILTPDEIEAMRIKLLILSKHEELVQYLKEKYPKEFI